MTQLTMFWRLMPEEQLTMRFWKDQKKYLRFTRFAARSELRAEVAGSYLNWLWWVFNPFCMMLVYTIIFGYVFDASEPFFPVFVFIGLTMWDYFNRTMNASVWLVRRNKAIVTKVYLPKFVLIEVQLMVNFIKMMISFVIIVGMLIFFRVPVSWHVLWIIPILVVLTLFTFGMSCLVLHFGVFVEDLQNILKILLRFIFYGTGIFFSIPNRIHNPIALNILLHWNPIGNLLNDARECLLYKSGPELSWLVFWCAVSIFLCWLGVRTIYRYENSYAKVI